MTLRACVLVAVAVCGAALLPRAADLPVGDPRSQAMRKIKIAPPMPPTPVPHFLTKSLF
jgi:hypothetical protein